MSTIWYKLHGFSVPLQDLDCTLYLANTSVAAVLASGFPLSVFRFLMSLLFHHLPSLRVILLAVIA